MPSLRLLAVALLSLFLFASPALATWSIVIVDLATGEVAVAIATCLTGFDLRPNTIVVVPGFGVAAAQSFVGPLSLRELIRQQLLLGTPAQTILAQLAAVDSGHQSRQYGIVGLLNGAVTFTGTGAGPWAGGVTGQVGTLLYSIQGNVLTGSPVVTDAENALRNTPGSLGDRLLAAMQAASAMGGDGRCSCNANAPTSCGAPPPGFTKAAHIALMVVSRPSDLDAPCNGTGGCGSGQYWCDINIANQQANDPDPIQQLATRYAAWKAQQIGRPDHFQSTVTLTGTSLRSNGLDTLTGRVVLRDASGNPLGNTLPLTVTASSRSTATGLVFSPAVPQADGSYTFTMRANGAAGEAIVDAAVTDTFGRVGVAPQPSVQVTDLFGPCGRGAIANGSGGTLDALRIGGSAGVDRRVTMGLGQPFVLTIDPPVGAPATPPVGLFALWAHLGAPSPNGILPLGPGAGSLCFAPAPLSPSTPSLLLADGFGLGGWLTAGPAPWTLGFPGVPALLDVALQGAMAVDPQGTIAATNAIWLHIAANAPPTITSITPLSAPAGQPVTITGTNFLVGAELTIAGSPVPITARTSGTLSFLVPAGLSCDAPLTVTNPGTAPVTRTFEPTPAISGMPFATGAAAGGAFFVLTGTNLLGCTVTIGGAPLHVTSQNSTSIVGTTPPGTPGPATVVVANAIGCFTNRTYTYQ